MKKSRTHVRTAARTTQYDRLFGYDIGSNGDGYGGCQTDDAACGFEGFAADCRGTAVSCPNASCLVALCIGVPPLLPRSARRDGHVVWRSGPNGRMDGLYSASVVLRGRDRCLGGGHRGHDAE